MVHRDPETGQFLAHDDEPVDLNYSDHEFITAFLDIRTAEGSGDADRGVEYQVESDVLDLENDELGMLSWMNSSMSVSPEGFPEQGGEVTKGSLRATAEIGANLSGNEYLSQADVNAGIQPIDEEAGLSGRRLQARDDPGIWTHLNACCVSGYKDADADGVYSGQGMTDNDRMRRVFSEETMGGPYIDATDDVNIGLYTEKEEFETNCRIMIYTQMSFVVFEYENRRAEFAPYDPGPSMG
jgi:hypothetical protein